MTNELKQVLLAGIAVLISYFFARYVYMVLELSFKRKGKKLENAYLIKKILYFLIIGTGILFALSILKLNIFPLLTALGFSSVIIGLAFQEPLSQLLSGLLIILTRVLREGETVMVEGNLGIVKEIALNHTILVTYDGKNIIIPNKTVWNSSVTHFWPGKFRRLKIEVGMDYAVDIETSLDILQEAIKRNEYVEHDKNNYVLFTAFDSSTINFEVKFWVTYDNYSKALNNMAVNIQRIIQEKGLSIPFNQLDITVKNFSQEVKNGKDIV
jgi:small conductance mechanosensitive channel